MSRFSDIKANENKNPFKKTKLESTTPLTPGAEPIFLQLQEFYDSADLFVRLLACVSNGAATHLSEDFLLSGPILQRLVAGDKRMKRKTLSGSECNFFFAKAKADGHLTQLEAPSKVGGKEAKAGYYKIEVEEILAYIDSARGSPDDPAPAHAQQEASIQAPPTPIHGSDYVYNEEEANAELGVA